jgi:hypothetical protein
MTQLLPVSVKTPKTHSKCPFSAFQISLFWPVILTFLNVSGMFSKTNRGKGTRSADLTAAATLLAASTIRLPMLPFSQLFSAQNTQNTHVFDENGPQILSILSLTIHVAAEGDSEGGQRVETTPRRPGRCLQPVARPPARRGACSPLFPVKNNPQMTSFRWKTCRKRAQNEQIPDSPPTNPLLALLTPPPLALPCPREPLGRQLLAPFRWPESPEMRPLPLSSPRAGATATSASDRDQRQPADLRVLRCARQSVDL